MKRCHFCDISYPSLAKSHIIPESVYTYVGVRDSKKGAAMFDFTTGRTIKRPIGEYDTEILCVNCEKVFNERYENDALKLLFSDSVPEELAFKMNHFNDAVLGAGFHFEGLKYTTIKMFFLSILWRAHVSQRPFYEGVKLDDPDAIFLKEALLNQIPISQEKFPIVIISFINSKKLHPMIAPPMPIPDIKNPSQKIGHLFLIGKSFYFMYNHANNSIPKVEHYSIKKNGEMRILSIDDEIAKTMINSYFKRKIE